MVNLKAYPEVLGARAVGFAQAAQDAAQQVGQTVGIAPPATELAMLGRGTPLSRVTVFAQHADAALPGAATGFLPAEALRDAGARGSIVNHAEHKIPHPQVQATVERLRAAGLWSLVCADALPETRAVASFAPTYVAVEPPQLIGGNVSVTSADPAIVRDAASAVHDASPKTLALCGAGVKSGADVAAAVRLGAHGVLLASGVVKAPDPRAVLVELLRALP